MRRVWKWTNNQVVKLEKVKGVLGSLKKYYPLTLRQVYYQLVAQGVIANKVSEYNMLSKLLKHARIDGKIGWEVIEDRLRSAQLNKGWSGKESFIRASLDYFLTGYRRDLQQGQPNYVELWIEKDALSSIFQRVADPYCVPVCTCRGFSSVSFLDQLKERVLSCQTRGQKAILLYFGDFDPSGEEMLPAMEITLELEMGVDDIVYEKIALSKDDIERYNLPHDPDAVKKSDSRYQKFVEKWGLYAVELDALPPDILEGKIEKAILDHIDLDKFEGQVDLKGEEDQELTELRQEVREWMRSR